MPTPLRIGICATAAFCLAALGLPVACQAAPRPALRLRGAEPDLVLAKPARLSLDVSLSELPAKLVEQFSLPVYLDAAAIEEAHIAQNTALKCAGQYTSVDEGLAALLVPAGLGWLVDDGVLVITSAEAAAGRLECRIYQLLQALDFDELIDNIVKIDPKSWSENGGTGAVARLEPDLLLILQTRDVHRQVGAQFAAQMRPLPHVAARQLRPAAAWAAQHRALGQVVNCEFNSEPLKQVLQKLSERGKLPITLDEQDEIKPNTAVSLDLEGVRLATALRRLLGPLGLTYLPDKRGLLVTTPEVAEGRQFTVLYPAQDLVAGNPPEAIILAIERTVEPISWSSVGGGGTITFLPPRNSFEVDQTYDAHCRLEQWIGDLRAARKR